MMRLLALEDFSRHLGETFAVTVNGSEVAFALVQATPLPVRPHSLGARAPFSLIFRNTAPVLFPQQTYNAAHAVLGTIWVFLVPLARDTEGFGKFVPPSSVERAPSSSEGVPGSTTSIAIGG